MIEVVSRSAYRISIRDEAGAWHDRQKYTGTLMGSITSALKRTGFFYTDVKNMGVVLGRDTFTGVRIAVVTANIFHLIAHTDVGIVPEGFFDVPHTQRATIWSCVAWGVRVMPTYTAPPHITVKKHRASQ